MMRAGVVYGGGCMDYNYYLRLINLKYKLPLWKKKTCQKSSTGCVLIANRAAYTYLWFILHTKIIEHLVQDLQCLRSSDKSRMVQNAS